jgi:hypothetical protein
MSEPERDKMVEDRWRTYLSTGESERERRQRHFFRWLPGTPRCKNCYAPFAGPGSIVVRVFYGKQPSKLNPQLCNVCEQFAKKYQGGAEIELSLLFADVRGSTNLAEGMSPRDYSKLINRFYVRGAKTRAPCVGGGPRDSSRNRARSPRRAVDPTGGGGAYGHRVRWVSRDGRRHVGHYCARRRGEYDGPPGIHRSTGRGVDQ